MRSGPQIGKSAPNFLTVGVYKKKLGKIRLSDYRGKKYVILVFYPANFTPVSQTELIELNNRIKEFRKLSAQILAILMIPHFPTYVVFYLVVKKVDYKI